MSSVSERLLARRRRTLLQRYAGKLSFPYHFRQTLHRLLYGTAIFVPAINLTICYKEYHEKSISFPSRRFRADGLWFGETSPIDREALVARNNPQVSSFDSLASLSVGNGEFAFTVDATGLQTFPAMYSKGVPLGTQSQWGWHSFANPKGYKHEETLKSFDFGRGHEELYACQFKEPSRQKESSDWFRVNPHRLHLGIIGLELGEGVKASDITEIQQTLNMWKGEITSHFMLNGNAFDVQTVCHPNRDMISACVTSRAHAGVNLRFPYPTGGHADDACNWNANDKHSTTIVRRMLKVLC